eukprot:snap_masked-scaffold_7-processed-gene-18.26-mRNA-1 protein AED:1.00 eAED:1.00 QI:0/0/0/0/1/1/2/0/338
MEEVLSTVFPFWDILRDTSETKFLLHSLGNELFHQTEGDIQKWEGKFSWVAYLQIGVLLFAINWSHRAIITPWARNIFKYLSQGSEVPKLVIFKFCQAQSEFLWYTVFSLMGLKLLFFREKPLGWLQSTYTWWTDEPSLNLATQTPDLYAFYYLYSARYVQQFISVLLEPRRKDFMEMQLHHFSTAVLTLTTLNVGFLKIGLVIMVLMDLADPFLHIGKQFVYLRDYTEEKSTRRIMGVLADLWFAVFVLAFTATRIFGYTYVVLTGFTDNFEIKMIDDEKFDIWNVFERIEIPERICLSLLLLFWFQAIVKLVMKVARGDEVDDSRSEASEDSTGKN